MNEFKSSRKTAIGFGLAMLALVLVMSLSLQLTAEDKVSDSFLNYDINADGSLSIEEFNDVDLFSQVDTNQDGVITLTEAKAAASQGAETGVGGTHARLGPRGGGTRPGTSRRIDPLHPGRDVVHLGP